MIDLNNAILILSFDHTDFLVLNKFELDNSLKQSLYHSYQFPTE